MNILELGNELALLYSERAVVVTAPLADYYWRTGLTVIVSLGQLLMSTYLKGTRLRSSQRDHSQRLSRLT